MVLTWTASTTAFADGYKIYRSTESTGPWTEIAITVNGPSTTTYRDDTAPTSILYYKINSYRYNWTSVDSNTASAPLVGLL